MSNKSKIAWVNGLIAFLIAAVFMLSFYIAKSGIVFMHALQCVIDWFDIYDE